MTKTLLQFWDYGGSYETKERDEWFVLTDKGTRVGYKYYQTNGSGEFYFDKNSKYVILIGEYVESIEVSCSEKLIKTRYKNKRIKVVYEEDLVL